MADTRSDEEAPKGSPFGRSPDKRRTRVIFGLFEPKTPMRPIIERLHEMKFPAQEVEISSAIPIMAQPTGVGWKRVRLLHVTMIAGAVGILFGILLTAGTALHYPLFTGGKPLVSPPIVGIISYEMMMLFAIVATFVTTVVKIVRSRRAGAGHDPRIDEGFVGISVRIGREDPRSGPVRDLFQQAGAVEVETE